MPRSDPILTLRTVGLLTVTAADGSDRTPGSKKSKGLLALLAMAPGHRRTRAWLQDKLWSDRGPVQGAASLRQALSEIRKAFKGARDCLRSDRQVVWFEPASVAICHEPAASSTTDEVILFEGLDIADIEFENWLRDQRTRFQSEPTIVKANLPNEPASQKPKLQLVIARERVPSSPTRERLSIESLTDIVAQSVKELGDVEVIEHRGDACSELISRSPNTLVVNADVAEDPVGVTCRLVLRSSQGNRLLWTNHIDSRGATSILDDAVLLSDLNQFVEQIYRSFASTAGEVRRHSSLLCWQGIQTLMRLKMEDLEAADRLFAEAFELEPRGVYLAWRAYLRTFRLVEFIPSDRQAVADEAVAFMRRSIELEPANSYVAGFSAQVHSIVRQSYVAAFEMAERSIKLNPANPIGWTCLGMAECNLGRTAAGFRHTLHARELSGPTPFRFFVDAFACIAASMAGDVENAILLGEASHGVSPAFKPPLRFLSALYLLKDQREQSEGFVDKLKVSEPNFSYELLRDKSYPVSSLHRSGLLDKLPKRQL